MPSSAFDAINRVAHLCYNSYYAKGMAIVYLNRSGAWTTEWGFLDKASIRVIDIYSLREIGNLVYDNICSKKNQASNLHK